MANPRTAGAWRQWFARSGLKIRHLQVIQVVERTRNIGRAARELHLSQPAVSKAVQQVERAAGMPLFERRSDGSYPTTAGSALVRYANEVFGALERAGDELEALSRGLGGVLTVGCNFPSATYLVPKAIVLLTRANPLLSVTIHEASLEVLLPELRSFKLDVVVGRWPRGSQTEDLEEHGAFQQAMVVVSAPDHPLARLKRVRWAQLAKCDWILPPLGSAARADIDELFRLQKLKPRGTRIESFSAYANGLLVRELGAVSIVPAAVTRHLSGERSFAVLNVDMPPVFGATSAITLRDRKPSASVTSFIECLANAASGR